MKKLMTMVVMFIATACGSPISEELPDEPNQEDVPTTPEDTSGEVLGKYYVKNVMQLHDYIYDHPEMKITKENLNALAGINAAEYVTDVKLEGMIYTITYSNGRKSYLDTEKYSSKEMKEYPGLPKMPQSSHQTRMSDSDIDSMFNMLDSECVKSDKVLVWEAFDFKASLMDSIYPLLRDYIGLENVTYLRGEECKWDKLTNLSDYGLIFIDSHGNEDCLISGELATIYDTRDKNQAVYSLLYDKKKVEYRWVMGPKFFREILNPSFVNGVIVNTACFSMMFGQIHDKILEKGYSAYIGNTGICDAAKVQTQTTRFLESFIKNRDNLKNSFDSVPTPAYPVSYVGKQYTDTFTIKTKYPKLKFHYNHKSDSIVLKKISDTYNLEWDFTQPINDNFYPDNVKLSAEHNRVIGLYLNDMNIEGHIISEIEQLNCLMTIKMGYNKLNGEIPECLGRLPILMTLELSNNRLTGTIPTSFEGFFNKKSLYLNNNNLNGEIPFGDSSCRFNNSIPLHLDYRYTYDMNKHIAYDNGKGLYFIDEPIFQLINPKSN